MTVVTIGNQSFETARRPDGTYVSTPLGSNMPTKEGPKKSGLVASFPSDSGNDPHDITYTPNLGLVCTCIGYGFRRYCRYTKAIREMLDSGETTIEELLEYPLVED